MTRKDFELIAGVLLSLRKTYGETIPHAKLVEEFCRGLYGTNPRFKRERFEIASGA